jgi:hypothetical protein
MTLFVSRFRRKGRLIAPQSDAGEDFGKVGPKMPWDALNLSFAISKTTTGSPSRAFSDLSWLNL